MTIPRDSREELSATTAIAHPNIALVKYWGKAPLPGNVPAVPSLSVTLQQLATTTRLRLDPALDADQLTLNGIRQAASAATRVRVQQCLDYMRELAGCRQFAHVDTDNDFPTGAGLASSASGFAALVVAADQAMGARLDQPDLSRLARRASASAARSLAGGFVTLAAGDQDPDPAALQLASADHWPLEVVIAVCTEAPKTVGSSEGMRSSALTSPFYRDWCRTAEDDQTRALRAVRERDFTALAEVAETSCLKMHAVMQTSRPALLYWNAATMNALQKIRELQRDGIQVFFTMDAGPQVKAVCPPDQASAVAGALASTAGVQRVLRSGLGEGARVLS